MSAAPTRLVIASDHEGFGLKAKLIAQLRQAAPAWALEDLGTHSTEPVDYPDYAEAVALAIQGGRADRGVLICGSGVGVAIAANKLRGVRACLCQDAFSAHQGVEHDDMNVLVLGAWVTGERLAYELIEGFLRARFSGEERHVRRLRKVEALERREACRSE